MIEVAMRSIRKFWSLLFTMLLAGSVSTAAQAQSCPKPANRPFRIFDATAYVGRPDWRRLGIEPIHVIDRGVWPDGAGRFGPPDPARVQRYVDSLPRDNAPIVMDFEQYDLTGTDAAARTALVELRALALAFRAAAGSRQIGFYGNIPISSFAPGAASGRGTAPYIAWQRQNDRLRSLQDPVHMLFPSAYTNNPSHEAWVAYATSQICEARRLSRKPVYLFIWPEYHDGSPLSGQYLSADFWRLQLETAYRLADGVVIWGGYNLAADHPRPWNPQATWYAPTLAFIRERFGRRL